MITLRRIGRDLLIWAGAVGVALVAEQPVVTVAAVLFIGVVPQHDLLVHAHETQHGHVRPRWLNEVLLLALHAPFFLSGTAYRAFHLAHHRRAHTPEDPETRFLSRLGGTGWSYLAIPGLGILEVDTWPLRHPTRLASGRTVARDLAVAAGLHAGAIALVGVGPWLTFHVVPMFTGLAGAVVVRAICEHHHAPEGDTRTMVTSRLVEWAWSNVNHHLAHHARPAVPWHELPEVDVRPTTVDHGYLRTALRLLREPEHFGGPR